MLYPEALIPKQAVVVFLALLAALLLALLWPKPCDACTPPPFRGMFGRGTTRAEDARGAPIQSQSSPIIVVRSPFHPKVDRFMAYIRDVN